LPPENAAALAEVEEERLPELLDGFLPSQLSGLFQRMPSADAVDMLQQLRSAVRREALATLPAESAAGIRALLKYAEDTAGGIMSNRFISLRDDVTVEQVRELLRVRAQEERTEDVAYLYVADAEQRLVHRQPARSRVPPGGKAHE
jgi:magnesium transporter